MTSERPTVTSFARRVYDALRTVPAGRVTTYKLLARAVGCGSCQAVGQALRHNPYAPEVPCHRVIRSDLTIGGFAGKTDGDKIRSKLRLLASEGVEFTQGRLAEPERLWRFERGQS